MPRTRRGLVLFWTAILMLTLAFQYAAAAAPRECPGGRSVGGDLPLGRDSNSNRTSRHDQPEPLRLEARGLPATAATTREHEGSRSGTAPYKAQKIEWGDITPPYTYQPADGPLFVYPGQNCPRVTSSSRTTSERQSFEYNVNKGVSSALTGRSSRV